MANYMLCSYELLKDLNRNMFAGNFDAYDTKMSEIDELLLKQIYHLGVHKMNDGKYRDAINIFSMIRKASKSKDEVTLSLLRESICYLRIDNSYAADVVYDDLLNNKVMQVATNSMQCEFYFLVAYFGLERNRELSDIISCIEYGYKAGRRFGSYCEGFFSIIQTAKEVAVKKASYDLVYRLDWIINEIYTHGNLTKEQKIYLEGFK